MKAMAPDRNRRYSTADEMLADLETFRKDEPAHRRHHQNQNQRLPPAAPGPLVVLLVLLIRRHTAHSLLLGAGHRHVGQILGGYAVHENSPEYGPNQIIRQDPEAGRQRKSASGDLIPIKVTVSLGARSGEIGWAKLSMMPLKSLVPPNQPTAATTRIRISVFHQLLRGRS